MGSSPLSRPIVISIPIQNDPSQFLTEWSSSKLFINGKLELNAPTHARPAPSARLTPAIRVFASCQDNARCVNLYLFLMTRPPPSFYLPGSFNEGIKLLSASIPAHAQHAPRSPRHLTSTPWYLYNYPKLFTILQFSAAPGGTIAAHSTGTRLPA